MSWQATLREKDADRKLLQTFQGNSEIYGRLLKALVEMGERLEGIETLVKTWCHHPPFVKLLVAFYQSMIRFWAQALKFHEKRKNILFQAFSNFNVEYAGMIENMNHHREVLLQYATGAHQADGRDQLLLIKGLLNTPFRHTQAIEYIRDPGVTTERPRLEGLHLAFAYKS